MRLIIYCYVHCTISSLLSFNWMAQITLYTESQYQLSTRIVFNFVLFKEIAQIVFLNSICLFWAFRLQLRFCFYTFYSNYFLFLHLFFIFYFLHFFFLFFPFCSFFSISFFFNLFSIFSHFFPFFHDKIVRKN